jgi:hypothetical protein
VSKLKNGKTAGEDVITNEMVNSGGLAIAEWLVRLFNVFMNMGEAPEDWRSAMQSHYLRVRVIRRNARIKEV